MKNKKYTWSCGNFSGNVKAMNIKQALLKSVRKYYDSINYPSNHMIGCNIIVEEIK